jgi:rhamnose transport system permease protein
MSRYFRELSVAGVLALVLIVLAVFAPKFFDWQPLLSRLTREAPVLVVACGMTLVLISRQIDISAGSLFGICGVCAGLLAAAKWPLAMVLAATIASRRLARRDKWRASSPGCSCRASSVTLATMVTWREALRWMRQGRFVDFTDWRAVVWECHRMRANTL